jgi:hemolysin activation/secretion protein
LIRRFAFALVLSTALIQTQGVAAATKVLLSAPFITGSAQYSPVDFAPLIGPHIGKPVSRALLDEIATELQALYGRDGYVVPRVLIIDSEFASSTPRLHIYEAQIAEVAIRGDAGPHLAAIMDQAALLQSNLIHKERSRQYLRQIEQLPGITLKATFEPRASETNRYVLVLNLQYDAVQASVTLNNRGAAELGRTLVSGRVTFHGLLGAEESITLTGAASSGDGDYQYVGGRVQRRFSQVGTQLDVSHSEAEFANGYRYSTQRARLQADMAVVDDGVWRVSPLVALSARNGAGTNAGITLSEIDTRALHVGVALRRLESGASTYVWSSFTRGIDGLGASARTWDDRPLDLSFSKSQLELIHVYSVAPAWRMRFDLDAQWSNDDLPAGERFTFGGALLGRAFDPATLIGDSGAALSVQLERIQRWKHPWLRSSKVYLQSDYGYAYDNVSGDNDAASATVGVSSTIASTLASLELSHPLIDARSMKEEGLRAFFLMQVNF